MKKLDAIKILNTVISDICDMPESRWEECEKRNIFKFRQYPRIDLSVEEIKAIDVTIEF